MLDNLQTATKAVDDAWKEWLATRSADAEAAYGEAYARWKALGVRGVGRPASGDSSLDSNARAQAARARQQQSARRWERVAPHIQDLRRSLEIGNPTAVENTARTLVKATAMLLSDLQVVHAQPNSDVVVLHGLDDSQTVLAFIPVEHLDDYFERRHLSGKQANLVVDANLDILAQVISDKYERGEHRPYSRFGSTLPRVDLCLEDLKVSRSKMSDDVLATASGAIWSDNAGGRP